MFKKSNQSNRSINTQGTTITTINVSSTYHRISRKIKQLILRGTAISNATRHLPPLAI